jgi:hypothetical protein
MKISSAVAFALGAILWLVASDARAAAAKPAPAWKDAAGPVSPWPRTIPARTRPPARDEILVTTLGEVETPLADARFDPVADRLVARDGRTIEGYFKNELDIPYYAPVDKSRYPVPPSGWCSWYYYYQEVTPEEILGNARWIAKNLAPYGARFVQIDDGWQGVGRGAGDNRDWTTIDARFRTPGMPGLAKAISDLGLDAGIWLAPHGQSSRAVVDRAGAFLLNDKGESASKSWEGDYLVDPTSPQAGPYLTDLFRTLRSWGYTYFKIDSQMIVHREYGRREVQQFMKGPLPEAGTPKEVTDALYRKTMPAIRAGIGPESYLVSCWGIPLHAMGHVNGSRTAGDVVQSGEGYLLGAMAVQQWNFLHNVAWYSDPDVLELRPPLPAGIARAWATLLGLTGQALLTSDRLPDLPPARVKMLRQVYPAVDIRPLDLFRPDNLLKPVVDLKVAHLGRTYDVVGVFNNGADRVMTRLVSWKELGLDPKTPYHVYDFWEGAYLGAWEDGVIVDVPPFDVKVLTLVPAKKERPVLLSTDRHVTQGWVDLVELNEAGPADAPALNGKSRVMADDPYTLVFGLPRGAPYMRLQSFQATGADGRAVPATITSHLGFATATVRVATRQTVTWSAHFVPGDTYKYPVQVTSGVSAVPLGASAASVWWRTENHLRAGYRVEVDGEPVGVAFNCRAVLPDLVPGRTVRIGVRSIWYDGTVSEKANETSLALAVPREVFLSDWEPTFVRQTWRNLWRPLGRDRSVEGHPLSVAGTVHAKGLGSHTEWDLHYDAASAFSRLRAQVGVDDEVVAQVRPAGDGATKPVGVAFEVWGDGKVLWKGTAQSGQPPVEVDVDVTGVRDLALKTLNGPDHQNLGHGDWLEARLLAPRD